MSLKPRTLKRRALDTAESLLIGALALPALAVMVLVQVLVVGEEA